MSSFLEPLARWLVDVYAGSAVILVIVFVTAWRMRQPAQRLALAWATVIGIVALSAVAAIPHWPRFHCVPPPSDAAFAMNGTIALDPTQEFVDSSGETDLYLWKARQLDVGTVEKALASIRQDVPTDAAAASVVSMSETPVETSGVFWDQADALFVLLRPLVNDEVPSWVAWTVGPFTVGGLIAILWLAVGAARAIWLFRRSRVAPSGIHSLLRKVIGDHEREPALRLSEAVGQPVALGTIRPAILLPTPQAEQVPPPQLEAVLAHEWAHIRRGDLWLLAAIRLLLVLFFAHPLYWWLRNRIRQDQEAIADAAAVGYGSAVDYAATLVAWCRLGSERHSAVLAFGGRPSQLKRRIAMLLNPDWSVETRCPRRLQWGIGAIALVGVLALSVLTLRPGNPVNADETKSITATTNGEEPATVTARVRAVQGTAITAQQPIGKSYVAAVLGGTVVSPDGKPLDGAQIAVLAWSKNAPSRTEKLGQAKTNAQGEFRVRALCPAPATSYEIVTVVTAPGFGPSWTNGLSSELKITLPAERVIQGKLIDLEGQPAAGVKLHVSRVGAKPANNGMYYYSPVGIPALNFDEPDDEMSNHDPAACGLLMNTRVMMSNGQVMVTVGENGKPPSAPALERIVFPEPGAALPHWPATVTTDADGRFTLRGVGVNQGVGIQVRDERFALQALDVPAQNDPKGEPVTLALAPARILDGTVTAADTSKPIPNARVFVDLPSTNGSFVLAIGGPLGVGGADLRGRQGMGSNDSFYTISLAGAGNSPDELPGIEVRADENGRFRLNLPASDNVSLRVSAPDGEPFLNRGIGIQWKKGMTRQTRDIQLSRGVQVRGKVTERSTDKPVSGARVDFWSKGLKLPEGIQAPSAIKTSKDGTFQVLLPVAKWHLLVNAAKPNYVCQKIRVDELGDDQVPQFAFDAVDDKGEEQEVEIEKPSVPQHYYPDAWQVIELTEGTSPPELNISLRQVMLKGQLVGPDGKPVKKAMMFFNHPVPPVSHSGTNRLSGQFFSTVAFAQSSTDEMKDTSASIRPPKPAKVSVELADGRFEIPLRDLDAPYRVIFLDSENANGGTAVFTGKDVNEESVQVKLAPCGTIKARFVDENGKPLAEHRPLTWAILSEQNADAKDLRLEFNPENLRSDRAVWAGHLDIDKHGEEFRTDAQGAITIRNVVPGVTYRIWNGTEWEGHKITPEDGWRDFMVEPGKTIDAPAIQLKREKLTPRNDGGSYNPIEPPKPATPGKKVESENSDSSSTGK